MHLLASMSCVCCIKEDEEEEQQQEEQEGETGDAAGEGARAALGHESTRRHAADIAIKTCPCPDQQAGTYLHFLVFDRRPPPTLLVVEAVDIWWRREGTHPPRAKTSCLRPETIPKLPGSAPSPQNPPLGASSLRLVFSSQGDVVRPPSGPMNEVCSTPDDGREANNFDDREKKSSHTSKSETEGAGPLPAAAAWGIRGVCDTVLQKVSKTRVMISTSDKHPGPLAAPCGHTLILLARAHERFGDGGEGETRATGCTFTRASLTFPPRTHWTRMFRDLRD